MTGPEFAPRMTTSAGFAEIPEGVRDIGLDSLTFARHDRERMGEAMPIEYRSLRLEGRQAEARNGEASTEYSTPIDSATHQGDVSTRYARST